jgi:hypothetical protein
VRRLICTSITLLFLGVVSSGATQGGAAAGSAFLGTWSGTWEGGGSGGFELTLEKGQSDTLAGRVSVTGEPTYKATLKTVSFDGKKMTAKYDFPPDPQIEIVLVATFEGKDAKGTWAAQQGGSEVASGSWQVTKQ